MRYTNLTFYEAVNVALNKLLKDALFVSGYEIQAAGSGGNMGILDADVLTFWCDGHTGYHIASKIKLKHGCPINI